jgi:sugar lactone lactonase YvrE
VVYHQGQFHMFRNGYPSLPGKAAIGYATSPDGVHWTFAVGGPIFHTDDVPYAGLMIMASSAHVEADGTWVLYFLIWDTPDRPGAIGRATAPRPTGPWTPDPAPVLLPGRGDAWDSGQVTHPIVFRDESGDGYRMYYTGLDQEKVERIGLATSADGIIWTKHDDPTTEAPPFAESDPVLGPGEPGDWDEAGAARARVVRTPEGYVMVYRAPARGLGYAFGLAFSLDGIYWVKAAENPILEPGDIPEAAGFFFPTLVFHDDSLYFFIEAYTSGSSHVYLLTGETPLDIVALAGRESPLQAVNVQVIDIANLGGPSDLEVHFDGALAGNQIDAYRLMLVKEAGAGAFDLDTASALPDGRFTVVPPAVGAARVRLPGDMSDTDGEAVMEGVRYIAYVLSSGAGESALSAPSDPVAMVNEATVRTLVHRFPSATGGLAVGLDGYLYAANIGASPSRNGSEIYRIDPGGEVALWVEGQGLRGASGNTFDAQGVLYQSSLSASTIHRVTPDGVVTEFTREGISGPVGIVIAPDGSLFVANCRGSTIQHIAPEGVSTLFAESALLGCPNGITMAPDGSLYVANFTGGDVVHVTPDGQVRPFVKVPGGNNGHIYFHQGLLYVVSRGGHRVYTLTLDGVLTPLAGTGERGHKDGPAAQSTFSLPNDIVASLDGHRLYVNEAVPTSGSANLPSAIRVIELPRRD